MRIVSDIYDKESTAKVEVYASFASIDKTIGIAVCGIDDKWTRVELEIVDNIAVLRCTNILGNITEIPLIEVEKKK